MKIIRFEEINSTNEYAKNINSNKQAVVDMYETQIDAVEEYTSKLIDSYNEYIDTVKEALDAERELYEFKKDIAKQTKDIAQIERRIASLSGSDNAADIAERRKLEAELAEAKEGLNDSYYAHSKDALQQALEEEANAYEETMNKFIERLRESLNTALQDMDLFMEGVFNAVITNAPSILEQYQNLGIALDDAITNPWEKATAAITKFGDVDGLGVMNSWIKEGGVFPTFKTSATNALKSPWEAGKTALGSFKQSVDTEMKNIVKTIESNVSSAKGKLNSLTSAIQDTNKKASTPTTNTSNTTPATKTPTNNGSNSNTKALQKALNYMVQHNLTEDGIMGPKTIAAIKEAQRVSGVNQSGKYDSTTRTAILKYLKKEIAGLNDDNRAQRTKKTRLEKAQSTFPAAMYAKGTLGTKRDEWAITDESWIGEEITLAAGKNGQLQYLKKGSAVMPADISANLVEWGKLNPNIMNIANPSAGINLMTNYVSKPELNLSFDALVKAGTITQEALPAVKELVQQELNKFTKQLNYSMKRIGAN
jgi:peptidoglycan hydrolase-like protein with peptidoglycan-binding domain